MGENATLALSVGLGIAGAAFLGPLGAQLGTFAGQLIGGMFFEDGPPNQHREGPRLTDTSIVTASYGHPIPWTFGSDRVACKMIYGTEITEKRIENTYGGGKGGGPEITTVVYEYTLTAAFMACRGVQHIEKVFANKVLTYYQNSGDTGDHQFDELPTKRKYFDAFRFYSGSEDQHPDPHIVEALSADSAPAFRGICYFMVEDLPLAEFGNRVPFFEVVTTPDRAELDPNRTQDYGGNPATGNRAAFFTPDKRYYIRKSPDSNILDVWDPATQKRVRTITNQTGLHLGASQNQFGMDSRYNMYVGNEQDLDGFATGTIVDWNFELVAEQLFIGDGSHIIRLWDDNENGLDANRVRMTRVFNERPTALGREVFVGWTNTFRIGNPFRERFAITKTTYAINPLTGNEGVQTDVLLSTDFISEIIQPFVTPTLTAATTFCHQITHSTRDNTLWGVGAGPEGSFIFQINDSGQVQHVYHDGTTWRDNGICYVHGINSLAMVDSSGWSLYDIDGDSIVTENQGGAETGDEYEAAMHAGPDALGRIWMTTGATSFQGVMFNERGVIKDADGDVPGVRHLGGQNLLDWPDGDGVVSPVGSTHDGTDYDWMSHAVIRQRENGKIVWYFLDRYTYSGNTNLKAIVDAVCAEVGLLPGELDTTDLAGTDIIGFTIGQRMSARSVLDMLRACFQFDAAEIDYKLKFQHRSSATLARTLDETRISFGETKGPISHSRDADLEIPQRVEVLYRDEKRDYQNNISQYKRADETGPARDQAKVEFPIVLTDQQAKDASEYLLTALWCERDRQKVGVSQHDIDLTPMDIVAYELDDGSSGRLYFQDVAFGTDGTIQCQSVAEDPELQISAVLTVNSETPGPGPQDLDVGGSPQMAIMDTVMLQDNDGNSPHLYVAANSIEGVFPGLQVERRLGTSLFYPWHVRLATEGAVMGSLDTIGGINAAVRWTVWDRTNTFGVQVNGTLTTVTESAVLDGANALMVGAEVIQFTTATLVSSDGGLNQYTLSGLLRGRRGTEWAIGTHSLYESVVLLDPTKVGIEPYNLADAELNNVFRGTDFNGNRIYPDFDLALVKNNMKPLAPVGLYGTRSGNDVDVTWRRRTRMAGLVDWNAGISEPPLNEDSENYEIVLIENGTEVLTLTSTVPSRTITEAEQEQAFGSSFQPTLSYFNVAVYQMSGLVGRGFISETRQVPNIEGI